MIGPVSQVSLTEHNSGYSPIPTKENFLLLLLLLLNHSLLLLLEFTYLYNILSLFHYFNNTLFYQPKIHKGNL